MPVAQLRGAQDNVAISDAAQWAQREQGLVLEPDFSISDGVDVLATDGARRTRPPGDAAGIVERFTRESFGIFELSLLEIPRRQSIQTVECEQVGHRSQLAVL